MSSRLPGTGLPRNRREARRWVVRHRGVLAALAAAGSVAAGLQVLAPPAAATVPVLTATRDLRWGSAVGPGDVAVVQVPAAAVPDGTLRATPDALGRLLASPVRRGEAITDVRLVGPGLLDEPGLLAVGIRIADAGTTRLVRAGAVVDVLAATADDFGGAPVGAAEVVAGSVRVLAVPRSPGDGALLLVAATEAQAARLAAAEATRRLSVALRG